MESGTQDRGTSFLCKMLTLALNTLKFKVEMDKLSGDIVHAARKLMT